MKITTKTARKNGFTFTATFQNRVYSGKWTGVVMYGKHVVSSSHGMARDEYTENDMKRIIKEMKDCFFRYQNGADFPQYLKRVSK